MLNQRRKEPLEDQLENIALIDLSKPDGRTEARKLVSWVENTLGALVDIQHATPTDVTEFLPGLSVLLAEMGSGMERTLELIEEAKVIDAHIIDHFNRLVFIQHAVLGLLEHLQRYVQGDLLELIPRPPQLEHECTCGRCPSPKREAAPSSAARRLLH